MARADGEIRYRATMDSRGFQKGAREMGKATDTLGGKTDRMVAGLGNAANALGITARDLVEFGKDAFMAAASADRIAESFKTTFGPAAAGLEGELSDLAYSMGITTAEMQTSLVGLGQLTTGFGFTRDESAEMAAEMFEVAAALAAFNPQAGSTADAVHAIGRALVGERDPLEAFGVKLTQAAVEAKALEMTGYDTVDMLSEMDLTLASLALITEGAGDELGQFEERERDAMDMANELRARLGDLKVMIGDELVTALMENEEAVDDVITAMQDLAEFIGVIAPAIGGFASTVSDALEPVLEMVALLQNFDPGSVRSWTQLVAAYVDAMVLPFRAVYNSVIDIINALGADIPNIPKFSDVAPGTGSGSKYGIDYGVDPGTGFLVPNRAMGGRVPGPMGSPQLVMAHGGEMISSAGGPGGGAGGGVVININTGVGDPQAIARAVANALEDYNRLIGPVPIAIADRGTA